MDFRISPHPSLYQQNDNLAKRHRSTASPFNCKQQQHREQVRIPHQEQRYDNLLGLPWYNSIQKLYAWLHSTWIFALCRGRWILSVFICQREVNNPPRRPYLFHRYHHWRSSNRLQHQSSPLFSSDSSDEEDTSLETSSLLDDSQQADLEGDDHELPFVRLIDNVIYFFQLYKSNSSAFEQELSSACHDWGCQRKRRGHPAYGHNINPAERRPTLLQRSINFVRKRQKRTAMTRVGFDAHKAWVLQVALVSRLIIFLMQVAVGNFPQSFKHQNDGFQFVPEEEDYGKFLDRFVNASFGGYVNWDAHYFLHISVYGYTTENILAFFPLLPMMLYIPTRIVFLLFGSIISLSSITLVFGVTLNTWLFIKCTETIYDLARKWTNGYPDSREYTTTACMMFCFNPASIFFSGLYTETLFAYLTGKVILSLFNGKYWTAIGCAAMSGLCRSNGIINVGFILAFTLEKEYKKGSLKGSFGFFTFMIRSVLTVFICVSPFLMFQLYGIQTFCGDNNLYDPGEVPLYCSTSPDINPVVWTLPYSYIQQKYWNVGFLGYFRVKQIPNFILATPVLYVLGSESCRTLKTTTTLMLQQMTFTNGIYDVAQAAHGLFLVVFCFFFVHVQVSTRMIMAACPYLFIYLADSHMDEVNKFRNREIALPTKSLMVTLWCLLYFLVGTVGFTLGLPWT